jgi:sigma-B regulation protein RsbU (phosphoserine phosphatase)
MLADEHGELRMTVTRGRGRQTLSGVSFATSAKIPREVFATGRSQMVGDLLDGDLAGTHQGTVAMGIRHVLCVPLRVSSYAAGGPAEVVPRIIGVLYLDGRERAGLLSPKVQASLEAFATQAALAIDSARLYGEAAEKARLDHDLRIAAEIQQRLLPEPRWSGGSFDLAATSIPSRTIGGDFFDYLDMTEGRFGFGLGDVAGKGPPAALLAASVQAHFSAQAPVLIDPAATMAGLNRALLRRAVEARFATMFYGALSPDGQLVYCNAGQEPPVVVRATGAVDMLDRGGPVLGLLDFAAYEAGTIALAPGDLVVVYSDGVTEARNAAGDEYGRDRMIAVAAAQHGADPDRVLADLLASVSAFAGAEPQADDLTVLILRYRP